MNPGEQKKNSKRLSYVLRHRPDTIGIDLGKAGWVEVQTLLAAFERCGEERGFGESSSAGLVHNRADAVQFERGASISSARLVPRPWIETFVGASLNFGNNVVQPPAPSP